MNHRIDHVAVLIPAHNEEELLPRCLGSVLRAGRTLPLRIGFEVVVAVDCSSDRTLSIAKKMLSRGNGRVLVTNAGTVGAARACAAEAVLAGYTGLTRRCWLANTDADCEVPKEWLLQQLVCAQAGVEAVAGIVDVDDFSMHKQGVESRFRETYLIHPDGTHPHVHGANLGVRADTYLRVGGWSELRTGEDHDLWRRLSMRGCIKCSEAKLKVMTSGRRVGRAPHGFADALAAHNEDVA